VQPIKSVFGLVMAAIPVVYCLGFLLYFNSVRTSFGGLLDGALGPTMVGLGVIGLIFLIPLVLRIRKLVARPAPPAAPASGSGRSAEEAPREERSDFDPDAAIARYLAKQSSGAGGPASRLSLHAGDRPARPTAGFGRRMA
jgi:hypothetical protein